MPIDINQYICSPGSERGVLCIILRNKDKIFECEQRGLFANHFSVEGHKYIYSAVCALAQNPEVHNIDSMLIMNTVTDAHALNSINELGGMRYIDSLISSTIADNLTIYVDDVRKAALKRLAYSMGSDIQNIVMEDSMDIDELFEDIQRRTLDLILNSNQAQEVYHMGDDAEQRLRERLSHPCLVPGYALGWHDYDLITQGQKGNELTVFVAESKTGKSVLLLNHAEKFSVFDNLPGLYIDTEMTDTEQEDRLVAIDSGVPYTEIYNGRFGVDTDYGTGVEKQAKVFASTARIKAAPMYHVYLPDFSIEKVTALVRKYKLQYNIAYVIFDYIKLPTSEIGGLANAQEYQRLGYITTCLKDIAGICDIPVITAAQANRTAIGNTTPDANSLGGSYRILQMATRLCFLRNKTDQEIAQEGLEMGNQKLSIPYQRNGASSVKDAINILFDRERLRMREMS